MATNLDLEPALLDRAFAIGGHRSMEETVTEALEEFIARREQAAVLDLLGAVDWDDSYDYKAERTR